MRQFSLILIFIFLFKFTFAEKMINGNDSTKSARFSIYGGINVFDFYFSDKVICPTIGFSYKFSKEKTFIPTIGLEYQKHDLSGLVYDFEHFKSYEIPTLITSNLCIPFSMQIHPRGSKYFFVEPTIFVCIPFSEKIHSYESVESVKYDTVGGVVGQKSISTTKEINGTYSLGSNFFFTPPIFYSSLSLAGRIYIRCNAIFLKVNLSKSITYLNYTGYSTQDHKAVFIRFMVGYEF